MQLPSKDASNVLMEMEVRMGYRRKSDPPGQWTQLTEPKRIQRTMDCQGHSQIVIKLIKINQFNKSPFYSVRNRLLL
jgi:hypothetical protein